jgi:hypothetical protein
MSVNPVTVAPGIMANYEVGEKLGEISNLKTGIFKLTTAVDTYDNKTKKRNYKDQIAKNKKYIKHLLKKLEKLKKENAITDKEYINWSDIIKSPSYESSEKLGNVITKIHRAEENLKFRKINAVGKQVDKFRKTSNTYAEELRQDTVNSEYIKSNKTLNEYKKNKNPDDLHKSQIEIYKTKSDLNNTALAQQKDVREKIHAYRGSKEYLNSPDSRYKLHTSKLANTVLAREKNLQADNLKYAIWESELKSLDKLKEDRKNGKQTDMSEYLEKIVRSGIRSEDSLYGIKKGTESIINHLKGRMSESVTL